MQNKQAKDASQRRGVRDESRPAGGGFIVKGVGQESRDLLAPSANQHVSRFEVTVWATGNPYQIAKTGNDAIRDAIQLGGVE